MSNDVNIPYDVLCEIVHHIDDDDFRTLHNLILTNKSLYHVTVQRAWGTLYLTTNGSVASAFKAILRNRKFRPWVKAIRFPDPDSGSKPPRAHDVNIALTLSDTDALRVLGAFSEVRLRLGDTWSITEGMMAAIMTLCPNLDTVIVGARPRRNLETLGRIFDYDGPFSHIGFPKIPNWRFHADTLGMDDVVWYSHLMEAFGARRMDLIPYPGHQYSTPHQDTYFPCLPDLDDLRIEDDVFAFDSQSLRLPTMVLTPDSTQLQLPGDAAVHDDFEDFTFATTMFNFHFEHLSKHVRHLHWKVAMPFVNEWQPRSRPRVLELDVDVAAVLEGMQVEDETEDREMVIWGQEGPLAGWSFGTSDGDYLMEDQDAEADDGVAVQRPVTITPSLFFARSWGQLGHIETTTGALYGLPATLFE
ncbi:hypothetical protein IMZ48_19995 [Candidatus Bathyarchaeota archaeon]|nr:hypothetical protein [Candidatus Bathyarchaeota archaeon]